MISGLKAHTVFQPKLYDLRTLLQTGLLGVYTLSHLTAGQYDVWTQGATKKKFSASLGQAEA